MRYLYAWGRHTSALGCAGFMNRRATPFFLSGYDGAAHDYKIYHQNNRWRFLIGVTERTSIAESELCWTPTVAWWFSETWDSGDALGGSLGDKLRTQLTNYATAETGGFTFTAFSGACTFNWSAPYHCSRINGTTFDVWTDR